MNFAVSELDCAPIGFRWPVELIGTEPTAERKQANKAILLPCLQAINPKITNDLLGSVSNKYRPSHLNWVVGFTKYNFNFEAAF